MVLALVLCFFALNAKAQPAAALDDDAAGRLFVLAFPDTSGNFTDPRFPCRRTAPELSVFMYSVVRNRVVVTTGTGVQNVVTLEPGRFKVYQVPVSMLVTAPNVISRNTVRFEADYPFVMYNYLAFDQSTEAWTPAPVETWGTRYSAACIPGDVLNDIGQAGEIEIPSVRREAPAEFLVIAAHDNTTVTFRASTRARFRPPLPPMVRLNANEAYLVQSHVDTALDEQSDIGGTTITSDKPVGVISGASRAEAQRDEAGLKGNITKNMVMEYLTPSDQHGREFVFLPTWDVHRSGGGAPVERHREYVRVYSSQGTVTKGVHLAEGGTKPLDFFVEADTFHQFTLGAGAAVHFVTEVPAQAMMHSSGSISLVGSTPCFRGLPCLSFEGVAPYMVELTPREQWPSFAPYYAPVNPGSMQHYVNVVAARSDMGKIVREDGSLFPFTRDVPGTDLVWGTVPVTPGADHFLLGNDGATFGGFVYGTMEGREEYRPGSARKRDDPALQGGGRQAPAAAHPAEYEECTALAYGYPLAPRRRLLRAADTLWITTQSSCGELTITIRTVNADPVGLRSITLDGATVDNARIVMIRPTRAADVTGSTYAELKVIPVDQTRSASGEVVIKDRTGKVWRVPYLYQADSVAPAPSPLDFGLVTVNRDSDRVVTIQNLLDRPVTIVELRLAMGTNISGFSIVGVTPGGPELSPARSVVLPARGSMEVRVRHRGSAPDRLYVDSLLVRLGCTRLSIMMQAETSEPIVYVDDLNFGAFDLPARDSTIPLRVCNVGNGTLTFDNPADPARLLSWADASFTVPDSEMVALRTARLGANECQIVHVTFHPQNTGLYRTTARFYADTRKRRDTSVWSAIVRKPGAKITGCDWRERWVVRDSIANCTKNGRYSYDSVIAVYNSGTSPARVRSFELIGADADAGFFVLDTSDPRTTITPGREILAGDTVNFRLNQKVRFRPTEERTYLATVRMITETGDTLLATLAGVGIESHGTLSGAVFPNASWLGAAYPVTPSQTTSVVLEALPTRPLTVDTVVVGGAHRGDFYIDLTGVTFPFVLAPGSQRTFNVEFRPQASGSRTARLLFSGDQPICDDSASTVVGRTFGRSVATSGADFESLLICDSARNSVAITNGGTDTIVVTVATLEDASGFFWLPDGIGTVLGALGPGQTKLLPVRFEPGKVGDYTAVVKFEAVGLDGAAISVPDARLSGSGRITTARAHIGTAYRGLPGARVVTSVVLDEAIDSARVTSLFVGLRYNNQLMRPFGDLDSASLLKGTILQAWTLQIVEADHPEGELLLVLTAPPGEFLQGIGPILNPEFMLFLSEPDEAAINLHLLPVGRQCVRIVSMPGRVQLDPICGMSLRLIESTGFNYSLEQNSPNPFNPSTQITFSIGLDGPTRLSVFDAAGRRVATLIDGYMKPGTYQITWDAGAFASGLYHYRLESGSWSAIRTMMLRK